MRRLATVTLLALTLALSAVALADAPSQDPPRVWLSSTYATEPGCLPSVKAITYYRRAYTRTREAMNLRGAVPRVWYQQCAGLRSRAVAWRDKAKAARSELQRRTLPTTNNWTRSVRITQRVFPGTDDWLFAISRRECRSCYTVPGGFICNYQGSGACGPMQFMSGTFYGYADSARDAVQRRGFIVDESVWDWRNPLGQALTAGYMRFTGRDGCHWCL